MRAKEFKKHTEGKDQKSTIQLLEEAELVRFAGDGDRESVERLLSKGTRVDAKDVKYDSTALHWASFKGYTEIVKLLLKKGADVNKKDNLGDTPLNNASYHGHADIVQLLLNAGADESLNRTNYKGKAALMRAKESKMYSKEEDQISTIKALEEAEKKEIPKDMVSQIFLDGTGIVWHE